LGLSLVAVAPSNSAPGQADTLTAASATSTATVGTAVTNIVTSSSVAAAINDTSAFTVSLQSSPATSGVLPTVTAAGGTLVNATSAASGLTVTVTAGAAGRATGFGTISLNADVAGTYVIKITPHSGANAPALTWTVTASAIDNAANAGKTTSFLNAGETTTATADATVNASMALSALAQRATIVVTPKNAADVALSALTTPATVALTVTISGPGTVGINSAANVASIVSAGRAVTGTAGDYAIGVFSDGTAGVATITISTGTTVLATETVTFYGAAAKITPTVVNSVLAIGANTGAITAVVTDAAGVAVPGVTVYASSNTDATIDDAYVASTAQSTSAGAVTFDLTGVAAGTAQITLTLNSSSAGTSTVSAVAGTMRVSDGVVTKVDYKFAKDTYAPGEAATITATVSNAAGVMPAGTYTVLATGGVTANYTVSGLPTTTVLAVGSTGTATYTVTIPTGISGDLQLAGTSSATTIAATFGKTTVVNAALDAATAATDAASEAIDAANAATDAANAAAEAADAATAAAQDAADAVAALSVSVAAMIDALKKQITSLTNLVIKIQKKVKA
jgi:hypothetical protein